MHAWAVVDYSPLHFKAEFKTTCDLNPSDAFGIVIRANRTALGISQEALAEKSGLDRTYISMLERGLRQPTVSTLWAVANVFGVRPSKIVRLMEEQINGIEPEKPTS